MKSFLLTICVGLVLWSCGGKKTAEQNTESIKSEETDSTAVAVIPSQIKKNQRYDELASYLSGVQQYSYTTIPANMLNDSTWKWYCVEMDKSWAKYDNSRLSTIITWRNEEMKDIIKDTSTLFYPFSGPDFLHANTFFPSSNKMILAGLEPVGSLPSFTKEEAIPAYLKSMHQSLYAVLNFSFFKTNDMKTDMGAQELNGT